MRGLARHRYKTADRKSWEARLRVYSCVIPQSSVVSSVLLSILALFKVNYYAQWISKDSFRKWQVAKERAFIGLLNWVVKEDEVFMIGLRASKNVLRIVSLSSCLPLYFSPTSCSVGFICRQAVPRRQSRWTSAPSLHSTGLASPVDQVVIFSIAPEK